MNSIQDKLRSVGFKIEAVEVAGETFHLRTMTALQAGQLADRLTGENGKSEFYREQLVATCLCTPDGVPAFDSVEAGVEVLKTAAHPVVEALANAAMRLNKPEHPQGNV